MEADKRGQIMATNFKNKGFTIIEMVIIFGILAVLSATLIGSFHTGEQQIALFKEQSRIVAVLSRAKFLSISTFGDTGVPCGYGVHFEMPNKFFIFKDSAVALDCRDANSTYDTGEEVQNEFFELDSRIVFSSLGSNNLDIVFIPPNPMIVITPNQTQAEISLKTASGIGEPRVIKISKAGQISTQ